MRRSAAAGPLKERRFPTADLPLREAPISLFALRLAPLAVSFVGGWKPPLLGGALVMNANELRFFNPYEEIAQTENRLPHWQQQGCVCFVTFRLADAVPKQLLDGLKDEREAWLRHHPEPWSTTVEREYHARFSGQIERWLDAGHGSCVLRQPVCGKIVADALCHFDGERCTQIAWIIMPNHVHALVVLHPACTLEKLVHSWKRHSALKINAALGRTGALWQRDYFDRLVRDALHFANCVRYIRKTPIKARSRAGDYLHFESDMARAVE